jgi:hypothetical protein
MINGVYDVVLAKVLTSGCEVQVQLEVEGAFERDDSLSDSDSEDRAAWAVEGTVTE